MNEKQNSDQNKNGKKDEHEIPMIVGACSTYGCFAVVVIAIAEF